jgi:hypothetical protein
MNAMLARLVAGLLVLVFVGPSVIVATCELTCTVASHHQGTPSSTEASCHDHHSSSQGVAVNVTSGVLCHESVDVPFAVVDAWLNSVAVSVPPAASVFIAPPIATRTIARVPERSAPFDPRPAHTPLRV